MKDSARSIGRSGNRHLWREGFRFARLLAIAASLAAAGLVGVALAAQGEGPGRTARPGRAAYAEDHVLVKLARDAGPAARREERGIGPASLRAERGVHGLFGDWYRVDLRAGETPEAAVARLRRMPGIAAVEPDYYLRALQNDPVLPQQWNFPMVQVQTAWAQSTGTGVTVAVLDTGMSTLANDFVASHILSHPSPYGTTNDLNGHGTHVSGTIAQATNNNLGAAGIAHGANIRPVKVLSDAGSGFASEIAQGIYGSALTGDEVINMSLGMACTASWPACSTLIVNDAIKEAVDRDVVIVAASGNDNASFVSFPANHPNVIAVGAVDTTQARAPYSNYGCALSLMAPGGTTSPSPAGGIYQQTYFNGTAQILPFQGTSMAAPHVAAAAAILRSKYPAATALQVRAALQAAAFDLGATGRDNLFGSGLLKINDALTALQAGPPPLPSADACGNLPLVPNPPAAPNKVDLRVASINVAGATIHPQTFQLTGTASVTISNWGDIAPGAAYTITLFRDTIQNGAFDASELLTSYTCSSPACAITPFGSATFTIPLSGTLDFRDRPIFALVDSQAQIVESNEANNVGTSLGSCAVPQAITIQPTQKWAAATSPSMCLSTPIVADLNQDGMPEVVFMDGTGKIRALSGQTGLDVPFFTPPQIQPAGLFTTGYTLAVGNVDADAQLEIIAVEQQTNLTPHRHKVYAFEHNGAAKWTAGPFLINIQGVIASWMPTIADLDHDGAPEVIAAGRILAAATGTVKATLNTGSTLLSGAPIAVNLDSDPNLEIVIGNLAFNDNGSPLWTNASPVSGFDAVVDFDGDGAPEILHAARTAPNTILRLYTGSTGAPAPGWTPPTLPANSYNTGPPTVADVDGDGHPEVAIVGGNTLLVYRRDGSLMWSLPVIEVPGSTGVGAFDLNNDGAWELILNNDGGFRIVTDAGGAPATLWTYAPMGSHTWNEYPVVADIDADGHAEILSISHNGAAGFLRAFQNVPDNWPATRGIWNQYAYHAENVGSNGQIPATLPANWWADNQFMVNPQPAPGATGPDLTAGQISATAGTFRAVIGNAGSTTANPVWVAFYDGSPTAGGTLIGAVNVGPLAPGASATALIPHNLSGSHNIHVVADRDASGTEFFLECDENNNKHNLQVTVAQVDVRISKTVSPSAIAVGQSGTYTLTIASLSAANSQNTVVTDTLPSGIQAGAISYTPSNCPWTSSQAGQTLTFTRPAGIGAGMVCTITINFTATAAPPGGVVRNVATLTDDFDSVPVNNQASISHQVTPAAPYDLRVVKYTLGPPQRGYNLLYFIFLQNVGTSPASGPMRVTDTMDGGRGLIVFQAPSWQILINGGLRPIQANALGSPWTCTIVSSFWGFREEVICDRNPNAPPIAPGGYDVLAITALVHPLAATQIINTAVLLAPNDSVAANNQFVKTDPVP